MRNEKCRVTIVTKDGRGVGRGFVADPEHVITCRHVAEFFLGRAAGLGDLISVRCDDGTDLTMALEKIGGAGQDICVFKRTDGGTFALNDCALWARGKSGDQYSGLGMSAQLEGIGLTGKIVADDSGGQQFVTAEDKDNRIEAGCSGAPLFAIGDGPLVGMVTEFQQDKSGKIYSAEAIARFWDQLKPFEVGTDERFPALTSAPPELVPIDRMIREVNRDQQKIKLSQAIQNGQLLTTEGFVIAQFVALNDDLPDECAKALQDSAFFRIMARLAPDSVKPAPAYQFSLNAAIGEGHDAGSNLLTMLSNELTAASCAIEDVRAAMHSSLTPFAIILSGGAADFASLTPEVVRTWAETLKGLAQPGEFEPVAMFINVMANDEITLADIGALMTNPGDVWHVALPSLRPIQIFDVTSWANNKLKDDANGRRARDRIEAVILANSGGRQSFRLRELKTWFSPAI